MTPLSLRLLFVCLLLVPGAAGVPAPCAAESPDGPLETAHAPEAWPCPDDGAAAACRDCFCCGHVFTASEVVLPVLPLPRARLFPTAPAPVRVHAPPPVWHPPRA